MVAFCRNVEPAFPAALAPLMAQGLLGKAKRWWRCWSKLLLLPPLVLAALQEADCCEPGWITVAGIARSKKAVL